MRADTTVKQSLISLGIDIGTSTTCLIISRLTTQRLGGVHAMASVEIVNREVLFRSPVIFTPLRSDIELDEGAIFTWVNEQLQQAGLALGGVDSGAVIITGESAQRSNANAVISRLSENAGKFVVATAGPSLEAILAGRGSGAAMLSRREHLRVLNLDVGGGTANGALFVEGEAQATVCAHVGGRLVRLDPDTLRIVKVSPPAQRVASLLGLHLAVGDRADHDQLWALCTAMASGLDQLVAGDTSSDLAQALLIRPAPVAPIEADVIMFSGGVGHLMSRITPTRSLSDVARYGDIGPMLAEALRQGPTCQRFRFREPPETVYATVIGAGMEVLELSGSTIFLHAEGLLPLQNVPMLRPPNLDPVAPAAQIATAIQNGLAWFMTSGQRLDHPVAVFLKGIKNPSYRQVLNLAEGIARGVAPLVEQRLPVVLVLEENIGMVLGNAVAALLPPGHPIICVDQIPSRNGDYIDIGAPMHGGIVVPVVVKSLVFHT